MKGENYFSPGYRSARKRFRKAAKKAGAKLWKLHWGLRGVFGEKLAVDVALLGSKKARRVLIHSSGVHGVEGFAGSAIQLKLLEQPPDLPEDGALVIIHCVNPYGMSQHRRVNESNVDLNRNFLKKGQWYGAHEGYHVLHSLLNPAHLPRLDLFMPKLVYKIARHGWDYLKQAGAEGQYEYPEGLFFGGNNLEPGPRLLMKWVKKNLKRARRICAIDVHTGVGESGQDWLIVDRTSDGNYASHLSPHYDGNRLDTNFDVSYQNKGGLDAGFVKTLKNDVALDFVTQEFGTVSGPKLLSALRRENHYFRQGADTDHPARRKLKDVFSPPSLQWERDVVENGLRLVERTAQFLFGRGVIVPPDADA